MRCAGQELRTPTGRPRRRGWCAGVTGCRRAARDRARHRRARARTAKALADHQAGLAIGVDEHVHATNVGSVDPANAQPGAVMPVGETSRPVRIRGTVHAHRGIVTRGVIFHILEEEVAVVRIPGNHDQPCQQFTDTPPLLALAGLALTACGDDSSAADSPADTPLETTADGTADTTADTAGDDAPISVARCGSATSPT